MKQKTGVFMAISEKILQKLHSAPIFSAGDISLLREVLSRDAGKIAEYKKGELIYGIESFNLAVGLILKGEAKVVKSEGGAVISVLSQGELFGCASLFCGKDYYVNDIVAVGDCKVLFIRKETLEELMLLDPKFSLAFIKYLSERLYYLNTRISTFTAGTAESKVASYLFSQFAQQGKGVINLSMSRMAMAADVGRASAYRALESLCGSGAVERDGKTIKLISEDKLKEFLPR